LNPATTAAAPPAGKARIAHQPLGLIDLKIPLTFYLGVDSLKLRLLLLAIVFSCVAFSDDSRPEGAPPPDEIVRQYCAASRGQEEAFKGASMQVEIHGALPNLKKAAVLKALRRISSLGRITYQVLGFEGDHTVQKEVIARYIEAEIDAQREQTAAMAVTPDNYKFHYKSVGHLDGRSAYIFQVTPRKKRDGLFRGEVWIDTETYLKAQETGYLVKNRSVFLKRVEFTRRYEIRDGMSVPRRTESVADVRMVGKAELTIDYTNFSVGDLTVEDEIQ
jgi:hypothetical protein